MSEAPQPNLETDPRFPSGRWTGFFLQKLLPGRHQMELLLTFSGGTMTGEGRDLVGAFIVRGRYELKTGRCRWTKRYVGKHDVYYKGFNEGRGIWGTWDISAQWFSFAQRGGFHIWPEGMMDPTGSHLTTAADLPAPVEEEENVAEPALAAR